MSNIGVGQIWRDDKGNEWVIMSTDPAYDPPRFHATIYLDGHLGITRKTFRSSGQEISTDVPDAVRRTLETWVGLYSPPSPRLVKDVSAKSIIFDAPGEDRKKYPLVTGLLDYFPDALADIANCSLVANEQHNPGEPLHWAREKSTDHADCMMRHFLQRGTVDTDNVRHLTKAAWRIMAMLQLEIEKERNT